MNNQSRKFKINGMPRDVEFNSMIFGRQLEGFKRIEEFKNNPKTKKAYVSQKHKCSGATIKEFIKLNQVKQYYTSFFDKKVSPEYWDDSFEIWYQE